MNQYFVYNEIIKSYDLKKIKYILNIQNIGKMKKARSKHQLLNVWVFGIWIYLLLIQA